MTESVGQVLQTAAVRAIVTALIVGAGAALAVWHGDPHVSASAIEYAGASTFVGILAARLGVEGYLIDAKKVSQ